MANRSDAQDRQAWRIERDLRDSLRSGDRGWEDTLTQGRSRLTLMGDRQRLARRKVVEGFKGLHAVQTDSHQEAVHPRSRRTLGGHGLSLRPGWWTWELRQRAREG